VNIHEIIRRPILTEKSLRGNEGGKYTFEVAPDASKLTVKQAVEGIFSVQVRKVNVINIPGRMRRRGRYTFKSPRMRKAIVTLAAGQKIDLESLT
jgi:large subunit ribosomal protein L23